MIPLDLYIEKLRNVGNRNIPRLNRLGIKTVKNLLWHFPVRYEDYTEVMPIGQLEPGQKVSIQGEILRISSKRIFPKKMSITNAIVGDSSGAIKVVWFNQPYIENHLTEGTLVSLAGKVNLNKHGVYLSSPTYEKISSYNPLYSVSNMQTGLKHTKGLVPIYPETEGITSKYLRFLIKPILEQLPELSDPLPLSVIERHDLSPISKALKDIHFPEKNIDAEKARKRFAFEDLFLLQIKSLLERRKMNQLKSVPIKFDRELMQKFIAGLPFELTADQKISLWEILKDLQKNYPMNRLMEGDVGSGKTVVALAASYQVAAKGYQTVFMVPTEVLAGQHFKTMSSLINNKETRVGLLTASMAKINDKDVPKKILKEKILSGEIKIIIGTHAVLQKDVSFDNLAFLIIDEQHRFGINQRAALLKNSKSRPPAGRPNVKQIPNPKSEIQNENWKLKIENSQEIIPHLLSMTATPIPRTLALTIYGDLDISIIKEKPKNRQKIITKLISPKERSQNYHFVREEVKRGRQVFVVCPRIEISDPKKEVAGKTGQSKMNILWADVKAVEEEYKKLSEAVFPDLRVAMLHGKLKPKEKNEIMSRFKDGWYDIIVSTSVIEVGVDVPNATIMMIESAERFGLAQLHQFRGRVGRGEHQSYCLLLSSTDNKTINQRLKALVDSDDGFELAEKDMKIRGPGEFFGVKQSGIPDLAMASLADVDLIKKARTEARLILKEDPSLKNYPLLKDRLDSLQKFTHFE